MSSSPLVAFYPLAVGNQIIHIPADLIEGHELIKFDDIRLTDKYGNKREIFIPFPLFELYIKMIEKKRKQEQK